MVARRSLGRSPAGGPHIRAHSSHKTSFGATTVILANVSYVTPWMQSAHTWLLFLSSGSSRSTPRLVVGCGKCVPPLCHRTRAPSHTIAPSAHSAGCGSSPTHGRYLPLASACPARDALKDTLKTTLQQCLVAGVKNTVRGPALCPCEEWRLRHSASVVAGSSFDCDCTGNKGQCLMCCVQQAADPAISNRGVSPRPLAESGALEYFKATVAVYPMKTSTVSQPKNNPVQVGSSSLRETGLISTPPEPKYKICQTSSVIAPCRPTSRTH